MVNSNAVKRCTVCDGAGPFGKSNSRTDGLQAVCKTCTNERQKRRNITPRGKAGTAWQSILKRAANRNGANPTYLTIEVQMTRGEFMAWAVPAFTKWMTSNPGKVPSVNRINDNRGYVAGNLEVIEWGENSRRRPWNRNINAPEGFAWCSGCKQYLARERFRPCSDKAHGLASKCRSCEREYHRKYMRKYVAKNRKAYNRYQREWKRKKVALVGERQG